MVKICIVLVSNFNYFEKLIKTYQQIREIGKYDGDIVIIYGNDMIEHMNDEFRNKFYEKTILKYFPDMDRTEINEIYKTKPVMKKRYELLKEFQYHKLYIFHSFFKQWDRVMYIDAGTTIYNPILPLLNVNCDDCLLAQRVTDFPLYSLKLSCEFENDLYKDLYDDIAKKYDLDIDHFISSLIYFDTKLIEDDTYENLEKLSKKYINCINNDQSILNLYFTSYKKVWKPIPMIVKNQRLYIYRKPRSTKYTDYIMVKR